jgi:hypothetical protein
VPALRLEEYDSGQVRLVREVGLPMRPEPGVKFKGDLVPPDNVRRCKICKQPIEHLHTFRVCCDHPRCLRTNRSMSRKRKTYPKTTGEMKQVLITREIVKRYQYAKSKGATDGQAYTVVANRMKMQVNEVIAVVRRET